MTNLGNPSTEVQTLARGVVFARDRVLQGDWTPKYANQQVEQQTHECEQMLIFYGCTDINVYAHVSPSGATRTENCSPATSSRRASDHAPLPSPAVGQRLGHCLPGMA
jgi:hypothetical protein